MIAWNAIIRRLVFLISSEPIAKLVFCGNSEDRIQNSE